MPGFLGGKKRNKKWFVLSKSFLSRMGNGPWFRDVKQDVEISLRRVKK